MGGLADRQLHLTQSGATDDLGLWLMEKPGGLEGAVIYNTDIYLSETGAAFKERYVELLGKLADQPGQTLAALTDAADSASARYLERLAASDAPATATPAAVEPVPAASPSQQTLLLPEQARLAQIWASALSIDVNEISPHETFFDLGGDSLLAMRVHPAGRASDGLPGRAAPLRVRDAGATGFGRGGHAARHGADRGLGAAGRAAARAAGTRVLGLGPQGLRGAP